MQGRCNRRAQRWRRMLVVMRESGMMSLLGGKARCGSRIKAGRAEWAQIRLQAQLSVMSAQQSIHTFTPHCDLGSEMR